MVTQSGGFDVAANTTLGLTGVLSGGGDLIKAGEGVLDLKGDGAGFTGRTLVNGGRLAINGRLGGSLDVGWRRAGRQRTIGAGAGSRVTVGAGGVLSPGNSIGALTIDGDLVMQRGARLVVETDPAGAGADLVRVSGNATLNGGAVAHVGAQGDYALNASYTIMEVRGTLSGRFDAVSSDFAFLTPSLAYDYGAGRVSLSLARNDTRMAWTGATRNQRAAAAAIDSIGMGSGNRLYDAVVRLPDDPALLHAGFDQLSGELHASAKTLLLQDSRYLRDAMSDRLREAADGARSTPLLAAAGKDAGALATGAQEGAYGPASWIQGLGAWSRNDGDGNAAALKRSSGGFLMGLDAPLAQTWRVGVMAGYSRSDFDVNDRAASGRSDNYHLRLRRRPMGRAGPARRRGLQLARHRHPPLGRHAWLLRPSQGRLRRPQRPGLRGPELSHRPVRRRAGTLRQPGLRQSAHRRLSRERRRGRAACDRPDERDDLRPWARGPRRASNWAARRPRCGDRWDGVTPRAM